MLLNNKQSMDHGKIKEEIKKFLELNENENELIQTLCDAVKVVFLHTLKVGIELIYSVSDVEQSDSVF